LLSFPFFQVTLAERQLIGGSLGSPAASQLRSESSQSGCGGGGGAGLHTHPGLSGPSLNADFVFLGSLSSLQTSRLSFSLLIEVDFTHSETQFEYQRTLFL